MKAAVLSMASILAARASARSRRVDVSALRDTAWCLCLGACGTSAALHLVRRLAKQAQAVNVG